MPDITMCKDDQCPLCENCYRFKAKPNPHWQSYFVGSPFDEDNHVCEYYDPMERDNNGRDSEVLPDRKGTT